MMTPLKTPLMIALAGALIVTLAPDAQARERGERPSFGELDQNGDGSLTQDEVAAFRDGRGAARFEAADTDGNGSLSQAEIEARAQERAATWVARLMERDADGDGALSQAELAPEGRGRGPGGRLFRRADADGDGVISQAEWDEMAERRGRR